jgi:diguanylate cyclase (GGDEF)-like protein
MDLDGFRTINESLGYQVGDEVLRRVAEVIKEQVGNKDMVARIGADEFAALILDAGVERTEALETLKAMANRIMAAISRPVRVRGSQLYLSFSMGINSFPDGSEGAGDVLAKSEVAMHQARQEGFGSSRFYRPKMKHRADQRLVLQNQLSAALQSNRLKNVYQSQVDINGRIIGVEALARLMLPDGRTLEPDQFISVAEETGVIVPLGYAVLNQALFDMRWWLTRSLNPPEFVAVNVCPKQFLRDGFVESVKEALEFNRVSGQHLELEITENLLVADFDHVEQIMHALRELGVRFVIDDFGAGHSSLAYLKRLPIEKLKIDRSFVQGVGTDESSNAIVAAVVSMGRALGLAVVAEGVQSDEIKACLLERGCTLYQGFLFDEPVPSETFAANL